MEVKVAFSAGAKRGRLRSALEREKFLNKDVKVEYSEDKGWFLSDFYVTFSGDDLQALKDAEARVTIEGAGMCSKCDGSIPSQCICPPNLRPWREA
jgi:hypothetical protein